MFNNKLLERISPEAVVALPRNRRWDSSARATKEASRLLNPLSWTSVRKRRNLFLNGIIEQEGWKQRFPGIQGEVLKLGNGIADSSKSLPT
jgi:hypothetical protein